jgi:hypothetical protein
VPEATNTPEWPDWSNIPTSAAPLNIASERFDPYQNYTDLTYIAKYGRKVDCFLGINKTVGILGVHIYSGVPQGFPTKPRGPRWSWECETISVMTELGASGYTATATAQSEEVRRQRMSRC